MKHHPMCEGTTCFNSPIIRFHCHVYNEGFKAGERAATERIKTRFEQVEDMVDLGMIPDRKVKKAVLFGEHLNNQTPDDGGKEE